MQGYVSEENGVYDIKEKLEVDAVNLKTTGSIDAGLDNDITINVTESDVMKEKPRSRNDYIISKSMARRIFGVGMFFVAVLFGFIQYFKHCDVTSLSRFSLYDYISNFFDFIYFTV